MPYQFDTWTKKLLKKKKRYAGGHPPPHGWRGWVAPSTQVGSGGSLAKWEATHPSPHWWREWVDHDLCPPSVQGRDCGVALPPPLLVGVSTHPPILTNDVGCVKACVSHESMMHIPCQSKDKAMGWPHLLHQ